MIVQELEKDLGNMRKARGGKTFEKAIQVLLEKIGIHSERPKIQEKKLIYLHLKQMRLEKWG